MEFISVGKILNTFGIRGELKIESYTDFAEERFRKGSTVYVGEEKLPFTVKSHRKHKGQILLLFQDNEDINLVERYKGQEIFKASEDIEALPAGEYYFRDIRGLDVYVNGEKIGHVMDMEEGLSSNYMRIRRDDDGSEHLVPFLRPFIEKISLEEKRIDIPDLGGLL